MIPINEISDEPKYNIRTVCAQTGIRDVTLRAWERRYTILSPQRAENHYRLYSERDIALLRWVKGRVDEGIQISNIVNELRAFQKVGKWPEVSPSISHPISIRRDIPPQHFVDELYGAYIQHDEACATELLRDANAQFDVLTLCMEIITPTLVKIGDDWYHGRIGIITEHFASAHLRGFLLTRLQTYPNPRGTPHVLIGSGPTEQHEMGGLMMALMIRASGYNVEYLGPDLPLDDLVYYAGQEKPDMIILTATMLETAEEIQQVQPKLSKLRPAPLFGFGGAAFLYHPGMKQKVKGSYLGDSLAEGIDTVRTLLPVKNNKMEKIPRN